MKIFANRNIWKKIVIIFSLIFSMSFVEPAPVKAGIGGTLMEPVCDLLIGLGDGLLGGIHFLILKQDTTIISVDLSENILDVAAKWIGTILAFVVVAVLIALGVGVIGACITALGTAIAGGGVAAFAASFSVGATIASCVGTILPLAIGGGVYAGICVFSSDHWKDQRVDLPLYSISPEEIFTNKIPLFDVNFFNPNQSKYEYDWLIHLDVTDDIKNASYTEIARGTREEVNQTIREEYQTTVEAIRGMNDTGGVDGKYYYATGNTVLRLTIIQWEAGMGGPQRVYVEKAQIDNIKKGNSISSYSSVLSKNVSKWYFNIRLIAIVAMMSVLVYIGIRILLSATSSQKAKYKQLLGDWLIGMVLLFTMHYIMVFSNLFVEKVSDLLSGINPTMYGAIIENDGNGKLQKTLENRGFFVTTEKEEANGSNIVYLGSDNGKQYLEWPTNLMGMLRIKTREIEQEDDPKFIGYTIMFLVMVIYTITFCWTYIKRVIYLAFLTMIAPMVALTYPIDKVNDGSAQGFNYWFKEYIFNLLLQPMHLLIYTLLISTAVDLALTNWIYALVAIGFISTAEKMVRSMFNFSKASTPGVFAGPAGAALTMTGMRWLMGRGPRGAGGGRQSASTGGSGSSGGTGGIISTGNNTTSSGEIINNLLNMPGAEGASTNIGGNGGTSGNNIGPNRNSGGNLVNIGGSSGGSSVNNILNGNSVNNNGSGGFDQTGEYWDSFYNLDGNEPGSIRFTDPGESIDSINGSNETIGGNESSNIRFAQTTEGADSTNGLSEPINENGGFDQTEEYWDSLYGEGTFTNSNAELGQQGEPTRNNEQEIIPNEEPSIRQRLEQSRDNIEEPTEKTGLGAAIKATAGAYGSEMRDKIGEKIKGANPTRTIGKLAAGALGAATFGTIGVAAGVASGDVKNVATYTGAGVAGGYKLGSGVAGASQNLLQVDGLDETYKKAYYGEKGYRERVAKENQKKIAQDENTIRTIMDKENKSRAEAFKRAKELSEYMEYKERDVNDWIKMEKYREKKKVVENGTSRQPSRQEVSQLNKWSKKYNISGMNGKTEETKRVQQFMQDENVDENKARRIIYMVRDFYNVTND